MDGKMNSTFGNIIMELNEFNLQKQPIVVNDVEHPTLKIG